MDTTTSPLNIADADPCCGRPLAKAFLSGTLDTALTWECPKCGCEWRAEVVGEGMRHWYPVVYTAVF